MRRMTELRSSPGTSFPGVVVAHVRTHQPTCIGPEAGMPGKCMGSLETDHVRVGGMGMKSKSIATNAARLCVWHHSIKTREGRTYRPLLLDVIARRASTCSRCQRESIEVWGVELVA